MNTQNSTGQLATVHIKARNITYPGMVTKGTLIVPMVRWWHTADFPDIWRLLATHLTNDKYCDALYCCTAQAELGTRRLFAAANEMLEALRPIRNVMSDMAYRERKVADADLQVYTYLSNNRSLSSVTEDVAVALQPLAHKNWSTFDPDTTTFAQLFEMSQWALTVSKNITQCLSVGKNYEIEAKLHD